MQGCAREIDLRMDVAGDAGRNVGEQHRERAAGRFHVRVFGDAALALHLVDGATQYARHRCGCRRSDQRCGMRLCGCIGNGPIRRRDEQRIADRGRAARDIGQYGREILRHEQRRTAADACIRGMEVRAYDRSGLAHDRGGNVREVGLGRLRCVFLVDPAALRRRRAYRGHGLRLGRVGEHRDRLAVRIPLARAGIGDAAVVRIAFVEHARPRTARRTKQQGGPGKGSGGSGQSLHGGDLTYPGQEFPLHCSRCQAELVSRCSNTVPT